MKTQRTLEAREALTIAGIIVILATMLTPILVQQRERSVDALCASRFHQVAYATLLYSEDYDKTMPITQYFAAFSGGDSCNDRLLAQLLMPYVRNWLSFRCPADRNATNAILTTCPGQENPPTRPCEREYRWALKTNLGYNYAYLAPIMRSALGSWYSAPVSRGRIGNPSATVLFVDSVYWRDPQTREPQCGGNWIAMPPCRLYRNTAGQTVDTFTAVREECSSGRADGWYDFGNRSCGLGSRSACWRLNTAVGWYTWMEFGGAFPFHQNRQRMTVAFVEGHVKSMTPQELAIGCDLRPQCGGLVQSPEQYLWDLDDYPL
ncbi:MAG: hypothetical protein N2651_02425 [Fimbriimonadales bacterium]|nr:hypothetical protein [Fimbriimonadales bacterium]